MILFAADLHLDLIWQSRPDIEGDAELALNLLCDAIKAHDAASKWGGVHVIIGGDIFDSPTPSPGKVKMFKRFVERLESAKIPVYGIQGNHDLSSDKTAWLEVCGGIRLNSTPMEIDGFKVVGLDYERSPDRLQEKLANVPPNADILVAHAPFKHLLNWEGGFQATKEDLPIHLKYALVGDVHKMDGSSFGDAGMFLSPGATHPRNVTEFSSKHGYWTLAKGEKPKWYPVPSTRVFATAEIKTKEDVASVKQGLELEKGTGPKLILSAKVASTLSVEFDQMMEKFTHVYPIVSVFDDTMDYALPTEAGLDSREMPELVEAVCQDEPPEVKVILDTLFNTKSDHRKVIQEEAQKIYGKV